MPSEAIEEVFMPPGGVDLAVFVALDSQLAVSACASWMSFHAHFCECSAFLPFSSSEMPSGLNCRFTFVPPNRCLWRTSAC